MAKNKPKQIVKKSISKSPVTYIFNIESKENQNIEQATIKDFYSKLNTDDNIIILNKTNNDINESDIVNLATPDNNLKIYNAFLEGKDAESICHEDLIYINTEFLKKELAITDISRKTKIIQNNVIVLNYTGAISEIEKSPVLISKKELFLDFLNYYQLSSGFGQFVSFLSMRNKLKITDKNLSAAKDLLPEKKKVLRFSKINLRLWLNWLILHPLKEIENNKKVSLEGNSSIYRIGFVAIALISLLIISFASFKAGISGDEPVNYKHAEFVYDYYAEGDSAALNTPRTKLQYYGQSFDNLTYLFNRVFKIENYYESRHLFNTITGWLTMLFASGIVIYLVGWRAGLITFLLILFSPRFLGHSWNNPKDIPFAFTYIFSIYFQIKFINELPKIRVSTIILIALSIALSISVRIGGLLLIAYQFMFLGIYVVVCRPFKNNVNPLNKVIQTGLTLAVACGVGYFLGLVLWPYALEDPIKNPIESLQVMTNFSAALRQTFMGDIIWSDNAPWQYVPVYILVTTPIIVFVGFVSFLLFIWKKHSMKSNILMLFVVFTFFFPIFYIIYKSSNVYGGWRHVLFTYPALVVISGIGLNSLVNIFKIKWQPLLLLSLIILLGKPIIHTFKNHPHQYVYFNQFVGGIDGAKGNYELDYYYHSLKEGAEWLAENNLKTDTASNIVVATNHGELVSYYLRDIEKAKVSYVRYYDRGNSNWDYAIIANSYINPYQQKNNYWPPENTIHTIDVDGVPIGAVIKRNTKLDYTGYQKLRKKDYFGAIADLHQAIAKDSTNEVAYINLANAYMFIRRFDQAKKTVNQLLEIYPKYDKALNTLGLVYFNERNYEEAFKIFTSITELNPKFVSAYYNLGLLFVQMDKKDDAFKYFQKAIRTNGKYKPPYLAAARILKERGKDKEAQRYIDAANKLK